MKVKIYENGPFMVNTYLVINEKLNDGFIIDPGSEISALDTDIKSMETDIEAIVCTHGHIDHVAGAKYYQDKFNIPLFINDLEKEMVSAVSMQARMFGVPDPGAPVVNENLPADGSLEIAGINLDLLHTPGHSPGSVSLHTEDCVFCGDALFNLSIGRTDLPGGDYDVLIQAISKMLFSLPDDTRVLCGHGPSTTIGMEKNMNPFFL